MGGGGQPDSDMKVDFAEIGIGKIGISDFFKPKITYFSEFRQNREQNFFGISYFLLNIRYIYRSIRSYSS